MSMHRVVLPVMLMLLLILGAVVALGDGSPDRGAPRGWIGLPDGGMDATRHEMRQVLLSAPMRETGALPSMPFDSLAWRCGEEEALGAEVYVADIGDPVLLGDARSWRVTMTVSGNAIDVVWIDRSIALMPLPSGPARRRADLVAEPSRERFTRHELEPIRQAWRLERLWGEEQGSLLCTDGRPAFFESCVAGRYAARSHGCGTAAEEVDLLWQRLRERLPAPRPAYWSVARH